MNMRLRLTTLTGLEFDSVLLCLAPHFKVRIENMRHKKIRPRICDCSIALLLIPQVYCCGKDVCGIPKKKGIPQTWKTRSGGSRVEFSTFPQHGDDG